jgi:diguanylate cyclase (GGDEF)-like protein
LQRVGKAGRLSAQEDFNTIAQDTRGVLWVGSSMGLFRVGREGTLLESVPLSEQDTLGSRIVLGLLFDKRGQLWVDTAVAGLHRRLGAVDDPVRFDRVSERHGAVGRPFGANLLADEHGRIWTHMHVYDPAQDRLTNLSSADGAVFGTGWFHAYTQAADGRMLFGSSRGILVAQPQAYGTSALAPTLQATELRVNGQRQPLPGPHPLVLDPERRSFSLEFSALDHAEPARNRYEYRLDGYDAAWMEIGSEKRLASYANLAPGPYTLRVRAASRFGVWNAQELTLAIDVLPAWWQTAWFRVLALVLLGATVVGSVQLRTRHMRLRQVALEHKVAERTAALQELTQALQRESALLQETSLTDPLTGLRNRRFLQQQIEADVAQAVRRFEGFAAHGAPRPQEADLIFFLIDLDHFKQVNDTWGHAAGDAVLQQMTGRLAQVFRDSDHQVRWGGEEFLVVARNSRREHATDLAERLLSVVAQQAFALPDGTSLHQTCSVGFCAFPLDERHPRALAWPKTLQLTDGLLYLAKHAGRNRWQGLTGATAADSEALLRIVGQAPAQWSAHPELQLQSSGPQRQTPPARRDGLSPPP